MWRAALILASVALGAAFVTHAVLAQKPRMPHRPTLGGQVAMSTCPMYDTR